MTQIKTTETQMSTSHEYTNTVFYSQMLFNLYKVVFEDLIFGHIKLKDGVRIDEFKW